MENMPEESFGVLGFGSESGQFVNQVTLLVTNLAPPPADTQYEVWLLGTETRRTIGVLEVDDTGSGELSFVDDAGENLLVSFERFEITLEPDDNPLPTGDAVYSSAIPPEPLGHIRHLLTAFGRAPDGGGLVVNLMKHADLITATSESMIEAQKDEDLDELKLQAEGLVNLIEGEGGENFGDLDGDDIVTNPGDGWGLLPGAENAGYIQTAIEHARFAAGTPTATDNIKHQQGHLEIAAQNLGGWAAQLRDAGLAVIESEDIEAAEEHVQQVAELADLFVNGQDADNDGEIEPIPNEGGAETVLFYAQRMADMPVLSGMNRVPEPASASPNPGSATGGLDYEE
jgi:hypothetical protein